MITAFFQISCGGRRIPEHSFIKKYRVLGRCHWSSSDYRPVSVYDARKVGRICITFPGPPMTVKTSELVRTLSRSCPMSGGFSQIARRNLLGTILLYQGEKLSTHIGFSFNPLSIIVHGYEWICKYETHLESMFKLTLISGNETLVYRSLWYWIPPRV